jgi:hypothetical protein
MGILAHEHGPEARDTKKHGQGCPCHDKAVPSSPVAKLHYISQLTSKSESDPRPPGRESGSRLKSVFLLLIDLVENAAIVEVGLLCLGPAAKRLVDGKEVQVRKLAAIFSGDIGESRPIEMLSRKLLALR